MGWHLFCGLGRFVGRCRVNPRLQRSTESHCKYSVYLVVQSLNQKLTSSLECTVRKLVQLYDTSPGSTRCRFRFMS